MPTYTYHCEDCDHEFDAQQSFSAGALKTCPSCQAKALYRVYKPARVVFKGSGFYINDSRKASKTANLTKSDKPESSNGKDETKSESKSETKSESKTEKKTEKKESKPAKAAKE